MPISEREMILLKEKTGVMYWTNLPANMEKILLLEMLIIQVQETPLNWKIYSKEKAEQKVELNLLDKFLEVLIILILMEMMITTKETLIGINIKIITNRFMESITLDIHSRNNHKDLFSYKNQEPTDQFQLLTTDLITFFKELNNLKILNKKH